MHFYLKNLHLECARCLSLCVITLHKKRGVTLGPVNAYFSTIFLFRICSVNINAQLRVYNKKNVLCGMNWMDFFFLELFLPPALRQAAWNRINVHERAQKNVINIYNGTHFVMHTIFQYKLWIGVWCFFLFFFKSNLKHLFFFPQHAMCSTSTQWRWSPWQALRPSLRPYLRHWLQLLHPLLLLCTSRCPHRASRWLTTRGSKSGSSFTIVFWKFLCLRWHVHASQ